MVTQELLKERYNYDPLTGLFTNRYRINSNAYEGEVAGWYDRQGYLTIAVMGKQHRAHRLAWLYHYGCWPTNDIDHINQIKDDNRIANLRDVTKSLNHLNRGEPKGYIVTPAGTYRVRITHNRRTVLVGTYKTIEEAQQAYLNAKQSIFLKENHG
jgi:hypothetical protein